MRVVITGVFLFGYSVFCGISLFLHQKWSLEYSLANQYLQLMAFSISGFAYEYVAGFAISLAFEKAYSVFPGFQFGASTFGAYVFQDMERRVVEINGVAAAIIFILHYELRGIKREKGRDIIDSIGSS